jgi:serine/threonine protein phosphatase 1
MPSPLYAIGDVHGQIDMLHEALGLIEAEGGKQAKIVFIGDYVDRGPDSKAVVQLLIDAAKAGKPWVTLKGNHDRYLQRFVETATVRDPCTKSGLHWMNPRLGGDKTLVSYGVPASESGDMAAIHAEAVKAVPDSHLHFIQNLPIRYETDDLFFAHAGIQPGVKLADQVEDDLLWIRDPFLKDIRDHGKLIVHGHTMIEAPQAYHNRINLDGGAGQGRPLYPAVFEGRQCWLLTRGGRVPLG